MGLAVTTESNSPPHNSRWSEVQKARLQDFETPPVLQ